MITAEIYSCKLWDREGVQKVVSSMRKRMDGKGWGAGASGKMIYRLYLWSGWMNKNKYIRSNS